MSELATIPDLQRVFNFAAEAMSVPRPKLALILFVRENMYPVNNDKLILVSESIIKQWKEPRFPPSAVWIDEINKSCS